MMTPKVCWLEHLFTENWSNMFVRKIIDLNLHILPIIFNCGLPQKYYCVQIDSFLKFGHTLEISGTRFTSEFCVPEMLFVLFSGYIAV